MECEDYGAGGYCRIPSRKLYVTWNVHANIDGIVDGDVTVFCFHFSVLVETVAPNRS